jgi:DNA-directed RNA polymerase subunit RPC12/RpoP
MKAIVCPQCGGLIDDVSESRTIAKCGYCGAKVIIEQAAKPQAPPPKPPARDTLHIPLEGYKPFDEYDPLEGSDPDNDFYAGAPDSTTVRVVGTAVAIGLALVVIVAAGLVISRNSNPGKSFTSTPAPYRTATPFQRLNVEPVTNADAIILPKPEIPKNLKIARRMDIEVYVSVDEQGNVYDASTNSDIEPLKKAAIEAAMKAKFRPSSTNQKTSGLLVYTIGPR